MASCDCDLPQDILFEIQCIIEALEIKLVNSDYYIMCQFYKKIPSTIGSDVCKALWLLSNLKGRTDCPNYYFKQFEVMAQAEGCEFSPSDQVAQEKSEKIWLLAVSEEGCHCG